MKSDSVGVLTGTERPYQSSLHTRTEGTAGGREAGELLQTRGLRLVRRCDEMLGERALARCSSCSKIADERRSEFSAEGLCVYVDLLPYRACVWVFGEVRHVWGRRLPFSQRMLA